MQTKYFMIDYYGGKHSCKEIGKFECNEEQIARQCKCGNIYIGNISNFPCSIEDKVARVKDIWSNNPQIQTNEVNKICEQYKTNTPVCTCGEYITSELKLVHPMPDPNYNYTLIRTWTEPRLSDKSVSAKDGDRYNMAWHDLDSKEEWEDLHGQHFNPAPGVVDCS